MGPRIVATADRAIPCDCKHIASSKVAGNFNCRTIDLGVISIRESQGAINSHSYTILGVSHRTTGRGYNRCIIHRSHCDVSNQRCFQIVGNRIRIFGVATIVQGHSKFTTRNIVIDCWIIACGIAVAQSAQQRLNGGRSGGIAGKGDDQIAARTAGGARKS